MRVKHDPPTVGRKDEEEAAAQARLVASNASVALYHLLRVAKGLGAKPTAILMARKMGEPIEHWDQLLIPSWGEPLPVIIRKDGERTISDWSPKRKSVGSGEKIYEVKIVAEEPKAAVPRRHLPRYVVKAKRGGGEGEPAGGKIYTDARRFKDDTLKELRRQIGTPVQKVDPNDLYETVFIGFIAHFTGTIIHYQCFRNASLQSLSRSVSAAQRRMRLAVAEEEVTELKRMGDVDQVERTGAKFEKTAPRSSSAEEGANPRRLSSQAWSRTLGTRGEDSTHAFAWFAPSTKKQHRSLASAIGAEPPGRITFADTSANVGRSMDARDRRRRQREREQAREKRRCVLACQRAHVRTIRQFIDSGLCGTYIVCLWTHYLARMCGWPMHRRWAAVGRRRPLEVPVSLSGQADHNLQVMEARSLSQLRAATAGRRKLVAKKREVWSPAM